MKILYRVNNISGITTPQGVNFINILNHSEFFVEPNFRKHRNASCDNDKSIEEFDPGSERTLAAWLRHASRTNGENFGFQS